MATFTDQDGYALPIAPHHVFGRLAGVVDSAIDAPEISRIHAVVYWEDNGWWLRDESRNGSWLNGRRVVSSQPVPLQKGDAIQFAGLSTPLLTLSDVSPPATFLCRYVPHRCVCDEVIPLHAHQLLPSEQDAEIAVYIAKQQWCLEPLDSHNPIRLLNDKAWIRFKGQRWQLRMGEVPKETVPLLPALNSWQDVHFVFHVSQDEEEVQLTCTDGQSGQIDLAIRSHHYLCLLLARQRIVDRCSGVSDINQGWLYVDRLARSLGITESHLNIQIYRARSQFSEHYALTPDGPALIERVPGKVRWGCPDNVIIKGGQTEYDGVETSIQHHA
ncbi:FHA domain-containing protein [Aestuariibacter halophilus]|uniref:FHA domain-containing protein n=1 Tax=Fluctibacter halophilus TaxID=226011 RepID=A0ABS8G382_9ALTE|nr:FHA domain-containing protein [Aestuariibacter halophilus]MCC2614983.1 FHA domain-containing protein [Aestuariibacter halophilus]